MDLSDDSGVAPMDLDGATPVKVKREVDTTDKENATPAQANIDRGGSGNKRKSAMKKRLTSAASASVDETPAMWEQLKNHLTQQMQTLAV
jgi:hypothetical protein